MKGPFIHTKNTSFKIMKNILIALIPLVLFAIYKNGIVLFFKGYASFLDSVYPLFLILIWCYIDNKLPLHQYNMSLNINYSLPNE